METVTYGEKNDGKLIMTFRNLFEGERKTFKNLVQESLEMIEIQKLSRQSGFAIESIIRSKLNIN